MGRLGSVCYPSRSTRFDTKIDDRHTSRTDELTANIKITLEPLSIPVMCRFTVDRPVYPNQAYFFGSQEAAVGSPLAKRLFVIPGVAGVLISYQLLTVTKRTPEP